MTNLKTLLLVAAIALGLLALATQPWGARPGPQGPVDDWVYDGDESHDDAARMGAFYTPPPPSPAQSTMNLQSAAPPAAEAELGLAAGGAKDVGNFRQNVERGFLPLPDEHELMLNL